MINKKPFFSEQKIRIIQLFGILLYVLGFILSYYYAYNYTQSTWKLLDNKLIFLHRNSNLLMSFIWILLCIFGVILFFITLWYDRYTSINSEVFVDIKKTVKIWDYIFIFIVTVFALVMLGIGIYNYINPKHILLKPNPSLMSGYKDTLVENSNTFGPIFLWTLLMGINFAIIDLGVLIFIFVYILKKRIFNN